MSANSTFNFAARPQLNYGRVIIPSQPSTFTPVSPEVLATISGAPPALPINRPMAPFPVPPVHNRQDMPAPPRNLLLLTGASIIRPPPGLASRPSLFVPPLSPQLRPSTRDNLDLMTPHQRLLIKRYPHIDTSDLDLEHIADGWHEYLAVLSQRLEESPELQLEHQSTVHAWKGVMDRLHGIVAQAEDPHTPFSKCENFPEHLLGPNRLTPLEQARRAIIHLAEGHFGDYVAQLGDWNYEAHPDDQYFIVDETSIHWGIRLPSDDEDQPPRDVKLDITFLRAVDFLAGHGGEDNVPDQRQVIEEQPQQQVLESKSQLGNNDLNNNNNNNNNNNIAAMPAWRYNFWRPGPDDICCFDPSIAGKDRPNDITSPGHPAANNVNANVYADKDVSDSDTWNDTGYYYSDDEDVDVGAGVDADDDVSDSNTWNDTGYYYSDDDDADDEVSDSDSWNDAGYYCGEDAGDVNVYADDDAGDEADVSDSDYWNDAGYYGDDEDDEDDDEDDDEPLSPEDCRRSVLEILGDMLSSLDTMIDSASSEPEPEETPSPELERIDTAAAHEWYRQAQTFNGADDDDDDDDDESQDNVSEPEVIYTSAYLDYVDQTIANNYSNGNDNGGEEGEEGEEDGGDSDEEDPEWYNDQPIDAPEDSDSGDDDQGDDDPSDDDDSSDDDGSGSEAEQQLEGPWLPIRQPVRAGHRLFGFQSRHEAFLPPASPVLMGQQLQPPIQRPAPAPAPAFEQSRQQTIHSFWHLEAAANADCEKFLENEQPPLAIRPPLRRGRPLTPSTVWRPALSTRPSLVLGPSADIHKANEGVRRMLEEIWRRR